MPDWAGWISRFGGPVDAAFDRLRNSLRRRVGERGEYQVQPYRGFGNAEQVYLKGRVLRKATPGPCNENDRVWHNVLATYRRFNSDEAPNVKLQVAFGNEKHEVRTDSEGYFELHLANNSRQSGWLPIEVSLGDVPIKNAQVLVPGGKARFGIISDIDDTVVMSHVQSFLKMARAVFLQNARGRVAFPGVAAFYRALQAGTKPEEFNPIFYVSSSPWNLYDLLADFFELNGIPKGPILLQDYGLDEKKLISASHRDHKMAQIAKILQTYPDLPFILIGDSGQHDPEIYTKALEEVPNRIKAIYIRDVSDETRDHEIRALAEEARKHGGELLLVADSLEAAKHAASRGWISETALAEIGAEKVADVNRPDPPLEQ